MAQVIMIASGKGGTGKSTVATFLATEIAMANKKVFLTELDAGLRSVDVISGTSRHAIYDILDILSGEVALEKAMVQSPYTENLYVVAAPYKRTKLDFTKFKSFIMSIRDDFDYVIIDTPAGIGKAFYGTVPVANSAIIVATPDTVSIRDARIISDELFENGIKNIQLIINKYDKAAFKFSGFVDGDEIIDAVSAKLLGVIMQSNNISIKGNQGELLEPTSQEKKIFSAIKDRIFGKSCPMVIK